MTPEATSLERLHDLVVPPAIPWWPPAPGWYVVLAVVCGVLGFSVFCFWQRWWANAYRRAAMHELAVSNDAAGIVEVLRRTALAFAPRETVARMAGSAWADWLGGQSDEPMSSGIRELLMTGIYRGDVPQADTAALRDYAVRWIEHHQATHPDQQGNV